MNKWESGVRQEKRGNTLVNSGLLKEGRVTELRILMGDGDIKKDFK